VRKDSKGDDRGHRLRKEGGEQQSILCGRRSPFRCLSRAK
jgi:hypothetical protein